MDDMTMFQQNVGFSHFNNIVHN